MTGSWKTVRIFISSTFRDMHAERDHLVRFVFPELKERCRKLRVQLIDVDLRWGVTEEDANQGRALDICLDEIDTCRPYFLGLLGFRYGYIPTGHQHSITAQEIYHGVLHASLPKQIADLRKIIEGKLEGKNLLEEEKNCLVRCYRWDANEKKYVLRADVSADEEQMLRSVFKRYSIYQKDRSYFFFRSEAFTRRLAADHLEDFFENDPQKLLRLKGEVRAAGLPVYEYNDLEECGQLVQDILWTCIEADAAVPVAKKDWLEQEAEFHELFMADRTRRFVGRRDLLDAMHVFSTKNDASSLLVVTGEPGCGKSALLGRFVEEVTREHPDWLILSHFVGASADSTNLRKMLRRICTHLNRALNSTEDAPEDIKELLKVFPELLAAAGAQTKLLLIIDAVNQLEKSEDSHSMSWLPPKMKGNVRFIISTIEGEIQDALLFRQPQMESVRGLSPEDTEELVKAYLAEIRHDFPNRQIEAEFFAKVEKGSPLYILVALEELRVFGKFEELGNKIRLLPDDVPELFNQVLERIEGDFNKALVRDFMSYIACGRHGMTAPELHDLLKQHAPRLDPDVEPVKLPDFLWRRLYRSFSSYLFERSGVIDFFHGQLKEAVGKRYLVNASDRKAIHKLLSDYFEDRWREPYERAIDELPHQLIRAGEWHRSERILCDLQFIEAKCSAGMIFDLLSDYHFTLAALDGEKVKAFRDQIGAFSQFVQRQAHVLSSYPALTFQQAANEPDITAPAIAAQNLWKGKIEQRPWIQWVNKPQTRDSCILTLTGHLSGIHACSFSPDGRRIVSASADETLKIWDAETGKLIATLLGHFGSVKSCAYSPDGRRIVSGSWDETLRIWDANTGRLQNTIPWRSDSLMQTQLEHNLSYMEMMNLLGGKAMEKMAGPAWVLVCSYSPDGKSIIAGSEDKTLKIWQETGELKATFVGHSEKVTACAYSPDGRWIISGSADKTIKVWEVETGRGIANFTGHSDEITQCEYSPDGRQILSASRDMTVRIWDARTSDNLKTFTALHKLNACSYSPDGTRVVSASDGKSLTIWNAETGEEMVTLSGHTSIVNACAFSPDGQRIVSGSSDGTLKIWNPQLQEGADAPAQHSGFVNACAWSPDGRRIVSASDDKTLKIWDANTGELITTLAGHSSEVTACAYSPDGSSITSGENRDQTIKIWDAATGELLHTFSGNFGDTRGCAYSPDGRWIVSAHKSLSQSSVKQWDTSPGWWLKIRSLLSKDSSVAYFPMESYWVKSCAHSPDGRRMIFAGSGEPRVLDLKTGREMARFFGRPSIACAYSPDGRQMIWAFEHGTIEARDASSNDELLTLNPHSRQYVDASAVMAEEIQPMREERSFRVHVAGFDGAGGRDRYQMRACVYSPDGRQIISASFDSTVRIWDSKTGEQILVFPARPFSCGAIGPGRKFVAFGVDGRMYLLHFHLDPSDHCPVIATATYMYRPHLKRYDDQPSAKCEECSGRFPIPAAVLMTIRNIEKTFGTQDRLPMKVWDDPGLLSECPHCQHNITFNPFVVDNRNP